MIAFPIPISSSPACLPTRGNLSREFELTVVVFSADDEKDKAFQDWAAKGPSEEE